MSLPELSIKRPVLATVMTAALVLLGAVSLLNLGIAEYPNMTYPYVSVQITYEGAKPEQIDSQIVRKVEEAVGEARGVRHITSTSTEGTADIGIGFAMEIDAAAATQEVRDKVSTIRDDLPKGINEPVVARYDMNADPVAAIAITSDTMSQRELSILGGLVTSTILTLVVIPCLYSLLHRRD
jgi:HAE1 family hydrophobic/amphiphilic exporter-1